MHYAYIINSYICKVEHEHNYSNTNVLPNTDTVKSIIYIDESIFIFGFIFLKSSNVTALALKC